MIQKVVSKDDDDQARLFVEAVRKNDYEAAKIMLSPKLPKDQIDQGLRDLTLTLDQGEIVEMKLIGFRINTFHSDKESTTREDLTYQIQFRNAWIAGDVLLDKDEIGTFVLGSHFQHIPDSLEVLNRFTLVHQTPIHYVVLTSCVVIPVLILVALVACIRTPMRRKWLWILFIVFSIGGIKFNWANSAYEIQPISVNLFGAGFFRSSPYSPYIFNLGLPLGAAIFLLSRRRLALSAPPMPPAAT